MTIRVGHLALRLRVPADLDAVAVREHVERKVIVALLERLEVELERRFGRAIVRIRRLPLSWRLGADQLSTEVAVERLAADLIAAVVPAVEAIPAPARLRPPPDAEIVVFADEPHRIAVLLADAAERAEPAWFHEGAAEPPAVWREAIAAGPAALAAVLEWLCRMDAVAPALHAAAPVIAEIVEVLPVAAWPEPARRAAAGIEAVVVRRVPPRVVDRSPDAPDPVAAQPTGPSPPPEPDTAAETPAESLRWQTEHAGVLYLVGRVLELDLAEHLWCAGLRESAVFSRVAIAISGDAGDPVWRGFGGLWDGPLPDLGPIETWAHDEVVAKLHTALGFRLVRFGVTLTPDLLAAQLGALAAELGGDPFVAQLAAALLVLAAARLGEPPALTALRGRLRIPGTIELDDQRVRVAISSRFVDVDVRRAGLDFDPGHVPWLGRRLELAFEESER